MLSMFAFVRSCFGTFNALRNGPIISLDIVKYATVHFCKYIYLLVLQKYLLSDLKNQTIVSSCVTHILPSCGYFKGQEQICFNPTSWHLVTYNFLRSHKF